MGADYCVVLFCISALVSLHPSIVTCKLHNTESEVDVPKTLVKRPVEPSSLDVDDGSGIDVDELGSADTIEKVDQDYPVEQPYPGLPDVEGSADDVTDSELTECQRLRQQQQHANRAGQHILQCTLDGRFNPLQCDAVTRNCWCVDVHGRQVPGTTRPWTQKRDCLSPDRKEVSRKTVKPQPVSTTQSPGSDIGFGSSSSDSNVDIQTPWAGNDPAEGDDDQSSQIVALPTRGILSRPGILAAIIVGAVFVLLCLVMIVMFVVYRMRKKDEGSYALCEETKQNLAQNMIREHRNASIVYTKAPANDDCFA